MMLKSRVTSDRPARFALAAAVTLLAAGVVMSAGCVSSGRYRTLEQERDLISSRNQALKGELDATNQKYEALAQEKGALASEKTALEARQAELEAREKALGSQLQQREEEAQKLQSTYDGLVGSLKKELEAGQIQVQQLRDGLRVNVAQEILFASGSAALDASGQEVLKRVADQLKQTSYQVVVTGHTDNKPIGAGLIKRYPTNWELAGARAASVVRLFGDMGLTASRLLAVSVADTQPVASNDTPEGRTKNRRIEIRLRPVVVEEER